MQFVDEATVEVRAGHGGRGLVSFRREAHVPFGGPDGGDGGRGGDVVFYSTTRSSTLMDHRYRKLYQAEHGTAGGPKKCTGADAPDTRVPVPVGTQIFDEDTGELIADLDAPDMEIVIVRGGRGGRGNQHYATPTRQAPRIAQPGEEGEFRRLQLSLKLVADIGLLGLPNAGKSQLLRAMTQSRAKVGAYPFTTLVPNLGLCRLGEREAVVADIPGLIEGAHAGEGLGGQFLKHIERTKVLIHLISLSPDSPDPLEAYRIIQEELGRWSEELLDYPQVRVINKIDLIQDRDELELWRQEFAAIGVDDLFFISALSGEGIKELIVEVMGRLEALQIEEERPPEPEPWSPI